MRERLQDRLDAMTERTRSLVPPERLEVAERALAELMEGGAERRVLPVGADAPEWTLEDWTGKRVCSADLLAIGPLVVCFFRGRWDPYCVQELEAWEALYPAVRALGGLLVAVSGQTVRHNAFAAEQHRLSFPVLSDPGLRMAEQFGLVYRVPEYHQRYLRSILVNVPYMNGDGSWRMPVPATFAVARSGRVEYARGYADARVRPEPDEVLAAVEALQARREPV